MTCLLNYFGSNFDKVNVVVIHQAMRYYTLSDHL